jgi:hypothetical protein
MLSEAEGTLAAPGSLPATPAIPPANIIPRRMQLMMKLPMIIPKMFLSFEWFVPNTLTPQCLGIASEIFPRALRGSYG